MLGGRTWAQLGIYGDWVTCFRVASGSSGAIVSRWAAGGTAETLGMEEDPKRMGWEGVRANPEQLQPWETDLQEADATKETEKGKTFWGGHGQQSPLRLKSQGDEGWIQLGLS
jgi:hypothetical protein